MPRQSNAITEIFPPTGEGIPCTCANGPRGKNGKKIVHHHGEFHHLMSHIRQGKFHKPTFDRTKINA